MAGLLDYLSSSGLLPQSAGNDLREVGDYLRQFDRITATNPFTGGATFPMPGQQTPGWGTKILDYLGQLDKATGSSVIGGLVTPTLPQAPLPPNGPAAGGDMADWYRGAPGSGTAAVGAGANNAAVAFPQQPSQPSWAQTPQQAQQALSMPDSTYAFGGQMVPAFGQAQPPVTEMSAAGRKAPVAVPNDPTTAQPTFSSELFGAPKSDSFNSRLNDFIGVLNPEIGARNDAKKAQSETARGLYEIYRGQGMSPNEAASRAVIEARNPKIMEERMKPYANMEQRLANDPNARPGGNAWETALKWKGDNKAAEVAAEKKASTQAEAQIALPGAAADFQQSMQTIEELRNHKGRSSIGWHGPTANIPADMLRGSEAYGAAKLEERLKSRVFGDQVKTMVGMGALSNAEGSKITDAVASLDRGLKKDEYNRALDFIQTAMKNGMDKIATKADKPAPFGWKGNDGWQSVPMPGSNTQVRIRQVQ